MLWVWWYVVAGYAREHHLRTAVQVVAIGLGVALGYGVSLINTAALAEFSAALRDINGQADASITAAREGFDEALFGQVAAHRSVVLASPLLETEVLVRTGEEPQRLTIIGVDALRAGRLDSTLLPSVTGGERFAVLEDGLFLSPAALEIFGVRPGDHLPIRAANREIRLPVAGTVPGVRRGVVLGVMDLGYAQWRLGRLGRLTRIDLRLRPGTDLAALADELPLPAGTALAGPEAGIERLSNLSRAYRVNLNVLALVALFTGGFLVFSLQAQSSLDRRPQLAYLRVAGVTSAALERMVIAEAAITGVAGSLLGLVLGATLAKAALTTLGADLGGGYFAGARPALIIPPAFTAGFGTLGVLAAVLGSLAPARHAAGVPPLLALHAAGAEDALRPLARPGPGLLHIGLSAVLVWLPPVRGLPLGAYVAIGALLVGVIALQPRIAGALFQRLAARLATSRPGVRTPMLLLATTRLARSPGRAAMAMAAIVASFSLMVAMGTMVTSFRGSVQDWLSRVLPADLYARAGEPGTSARFSAADIEQLRTQPGVARVEFSRVLSVQLAPDRAPVAIVVRPVRAAAAASVLPLVGSALVPSPDAAPPAWVSEAMVDLYGARTGHTLALPLAGRSRQFTVAGVWRDYARQFGSVVIGTAEYERITGDLEKTDASLWVEPGFTAAQVAHVLRRAAADSNRPLDVRLPGEIRAATLRIFDRSFAVTYVLELMAILIGLAGIGATFSAQAIARTREFGMLRHLGVTRAQILRLLGLEGALATASAMLIGLVTGLVVALILVRVVNRQSFHWSMGLEIPWALLVALVIVLLLSAVATAVLAGWRATGPAPLRAVHEDW